MKDWDWKSTPLMKKLKNVRERQNIPDVQSAEDDGPSSDLEDEPSSPIIPKSTIPSSLAPSRQPEFLRAEESVTGKPD